MKTKTTETDDWSCVPELTYAVEQLDMISNDIYEVKNCVRQSQLDDLVESIREGLESALEELSNIDTDVEWITKDQ